MELKRIYGAIDHLKKRKNSSASYKLLPYLQKNKLVRIIPENDYENLSTNSRRYSKLEEQVSELNQKRLNTIQETNELKSRLNSFFYVLLHSKNTLKTEEENLSKLERDLLSLETEISPKIIRKEESFDTISQLGRKYKIEDTEDLRNYVKIGKNYVALTQYARNITPIMKRLAKKNPNESYKTFKEKVRKILQKRRREDSDTPTFRDLENGRYDRDDSWFSLTGAIMGDIIDDGKIDLSGGFLAGGIIGGLLDD